MATSQKSIVSDFLDDDDDAYYQPTQTNPIDFTQQEVTEFPVSLAALKLTDVPTQYFPPAQWTDILQLVEPLHILGLHTVLTLALQGTWQYEAAQQLKREQECAITSTPAAPPINPSIRIEVLPDSPLFQFFCTLAIETITQRIMPLFGIMMVKSHFKSGYERYEFSFRKQAKLLKMAELLTLLDDIDLILSQTDAIDIQEITSRIFLSLLTTFITLFNEYPFANDKSVVKTVDFTDVWYDVSTYSLSVHDSIKGMITPPSLDTKQEQDPFTASVMNDNSTTTHITPEYEFRAQVNYNNNRESLLLEDILNNIVLHHKLSLVTLSTPSFKYQRLPISSIQPQQSQKQTPWPLNCDLFALLPRIIIPLLKAIFMFKTKNNNNPTHSPELVALYDKLAVVLGDMGYTSCVFTPQNILSRWDRLTVENDTENNLTTRFDRILNLSEGEKNDKTDQNDDEATNAMPMVCDVMALSMSLSLSQSYALSGFTHYNILRIDENEESR